MIRVTLTQSGVDWSQEVPIGPDISEAEYAALASRTVFVRDGYILDLSEETAVGFTYAEIVGKTIGEIRFLFPAENESDFKYLTVTVEGEGDFLIPGSSAVETLIGGSGNDTLDDNETGGGVGFFDVLAGGLGDDLYLVGSIDTEVSEDANEGYDTIIATTGTFIRPGQSIEELVLVDFAGFGGGNDFANRLVANGSTAATLLGRGGADQLQGGLFDDVIAGGEGNDRIHGGGGADLILFQGEAGRDTITGFGNDDVIVTTTRLRDNNNDGIIAFGSNRMVDFGAGARASILGEDGRTVTALEYDGAYAFADQIFYVYSRVGSSAGVAAAESHDLTDAIFFFG